MKILFSCNVGRRFARALLVVCLFSGGLQAQKVKVEYDKSLDFSKFKTFAWGPIDAVARPLLAASILGAIEEELIKEVCTRRRAIPTFSWRYTDLWIRTSASPTPIHCIAVWAAFPHSIQASSCGASWQEVQPQLPFTRGSLWWTLSMPPKRSWCGAGLRPTISATTERNW